MRVVSLLPSATEIVAALGLADQLVGISHDCDYPPAVRGKPRVTACEVADRRISSAEVDRWVRDQERLGQPLFTLDEQALAAVRPDLILTQSLCSVCAPGYDNVVSVAAGLRSRPRVVALESSTLEQVLDTIRQVASIMGAQERGARLLEALRERIDFVRKTCARSSGRPRVALLEWLEPVYCSGHWNPELVEIAGGLEVLGRKGEPSVRSGWAEVAASAPDVLVIACCGQTAGRAMEDWARLRERREVAQIEAVKAGRVYIADGNAYFTRPGPRIVDSLEILAELLHPSLFDGRFPDRGVRCDAHLYAPGSPVIPANNPPVG